MRLQGAEFCYKAQGQIYVTLLESQVIKQVKQSHKLRTPPDKLHSLQFFLPVTSFLLDKRQ